MFKNKVLMYLFEDACKQKAKDMFEGCDYSRYSSICDAFEECGIDPHFYANRQRERGELMPWAMISSGVTEGYLWREREHAFAAETTPDCRTHCNGCGANRLVGGKCDV